MTENVLIAIQALGGLGLFLLGMIIMTEGLREIAGDTIRSVLMRFTSSPTTGAVTGAISTAILQSSSATTVAAVGFVGAGLMTFTASLGIIFGANIGTTITGWLVALLGFKLKLGFVMLPLILAGAIMRLFAKGKVSSAGYALAGFGLIFVAIGIMQTSMEGLQGIVTPQMLPRDTIIGRVEIVLLGAIVTMITQSSSAGVAATMTALYAGAISFEQGLALIIGMDIGTTITAVIATIGGTTGARRTGISHLIYNLFTGTGALILITPYISIWNTLSPGALQANAEIALVAFHTIFNLLGVMLILPFTSRFASLIKKLVPEKKSIYTTAYDDALLTTPGFALSAVQKNVLTYFAALLNHIGSILSSARSGKTANLARMQIALDESHEYLDKIELKGSSGANWERMLALVHALDHLQRLHERCEEDEDRAITARETADLSAIKAILISDISGTRESIKTESWKEMVIRSRRARLNISERVDPIRDIIASSVANGRFDIPQATDCLEAIRWMDRVSHHIARIGLHIQQAILASGK